MSGPARMAKWVFGAAGIYGLIVLAPFLFAEPMIARYSPPGLSHPVYFYGFLGGALVMQLVYLTIARHPLRYHALMPIAVLAKLAWFVAVGLLWLQGRTDAVTMAFASVDMAIGLAFALAWFRLRGTA